MFPNLYEDVSGINGEPGVDCLELCPPMLGAGISITMIEILISRDSSLPRAVGVVSTDLRNTNEVYGPS